MLLDELIGNSVAARVVRRPLSNMHTKRARTIEAFVIFLVCVTASFGSDLQAAVREEASNMLGESPFFTCEQPEGTSRKPICSCDPSCNRYGDCCIDIAKDVPRERYVCAELPGHGRSVWVKASCTVGRVSRRAKKMCEEQPTGDFPKSSYQFTIDIPSFHKPSRVLYRNIHCVECNGGRYQETYGWAGNFDWLGLSPRNVSASSQLEKFVYNAKRRVYWMKHAGIIYNATFQSAVFGWKNFTQVFNTTECSPALDICPEESDRVLARKCALYAAYYTPNNTVRVTYKNYHCALCNGVSRTTVEEDGERARYIHALVTPSLGKPASDISSSQLDPRTHHTGCGQGQIRLPGLNSCRAFGCRRGTVKGIDGCRRTDGTHSCPWLLFEEHQVTILPNRTLYFNFQCETVSSNEYEIDSWTGHILVCVRYIVPVLPDQTKFTPNTLSTEPTLSPNYCDHRITATLVIACVALTLVIIQLLVRRFRVFVRGYI
ncbi:uncharacterized protein LOC135393528 [Ornithodoros turicata]|uniref:uncharacterized protein LOC135393528 n=1 Tax=Ornithodoros turicata TaxID=34597 RepID=UPI0031387B48